MLVDVNGVYKTVYKSTYNWHCGQPRVICDQNSIPRKETARGSIHPGLTLQKQREGEGCHCLQAIVTA